MTLVIRPARPGDGMLVRTLVHELAVYEKLAHEAVATDAAFESALFGETPRVFCDIAEWRGETAGLAIWFYNYSTFTGRHGIHLEDLYVRDVFRGKGIGKALIARLARRCVGENLARFEWAVLDWNTPAIDFYTALGARLMDQWTVCRVEGEALAKLGGQGA